MKYLFEVEYTDGTFFQQNKEDVSLTDPKRSAFFDVKQEEVKRFTLKGPNTFCVDLTDGHFEINGISIRLHDEQLSDFRLIYFRRHRHQFNLALEEKLHEITFRFGWQANDKDGKNVQRVMEIN